MIDREVLESEKSVVDRWWLFLLSGLAWFIIALIILRMNIASVATIGWLLGAVFLVSGLQEFFVASIRSSWRWGRVALGIFFVAGAVWSFVRPFGAFWALASALGLLLVLMGMLNIFESAATNRTNHIWWLGLAVGVLEVALGFWASQQYFPARAVLILLWAGFYAMFRGISEVVLAFQLRHVD